MQGIFWGKGCHVFDRGDSGYWLIAKLVAKAHGAPSSTVVWCVCVLCVVHGDHHRVFCGFGVVFMVVVLVDLSGFLIDHFSSSFLLKNTSYLYSWLFSTDFRVQVEFARLRKNLICCSKALNMVRQLRGGRQGVWWGRGLQPHPPPSTCPLFILFWCVPCGFSSFWSLFGQAK